MNTNDPPVPDPELLAPLRFNAARHADRAAKARVLGRLAATIGALGAGAATRAASPSLAPSHRLPAPPLAPSAEPRTWSAARSLLGSLVAHPGLFAAAAFVAGGVGGAEIYATLAPPRERIVYLDRPVAVPEPRPFIVTIHDFNVERHGATEANPANAPKEPPAASSIAGAVDLAGERALLDRARHVLAQGNATDAERTLAMHARRFPAGLLAEEREALAIKTLADLGRIDEARRRAARFKERFPTSIFGPAVDEALGAIR
jgi:hypothetical protein